MRKFFAIAIVLGLLPVMAFGATETLSGNTNWTTLAPGASDTIYLNGYTLTCNTASARLAASLPARAAER